MNSQHFVQQVNSFQVAEEDIFDSFDVESLFTNVKVNESLKIIEDKLRHDKSLRNRTNRTVPNITEMLGCCLKTTYFQIGDEFY